MATPGIEYISCLWAAWSVNAIAVPLSLKSPVPEIEYVLQDASPSGLEVGKCLSDCLLDRIQLIFLPKLSEIPLFLEPI